MRRAVPPSAEIQASIDKLLSSRMVDDPSRMLSELARLGARLIIQRAVEEEFDSWPSRSCRKLFAKWHCKRLLQTTR